MFKPDPNVTLIKKEGIMEGKPILTLPIYQKDSVSHLQIAKDQYGKLLTPELLAKIKIGLFSSETINQLIATIATRHKYKKAESYVQHIEEMLMFDDPT